MTRRSANIYLQGEAYHQLQKTARGQTKKQAEFQQKLIRSYQAMAKNKKLKGELAVWEDTLGDSYKQKKLIIS